MPVEEFKLPDVGEGVAEGELVQWLVEPGDTVTEDQPVAEVETDKALVEVPSPYDGTVKELFAEEGEMVPVGTVIISFEVGDGDAVAEEVADETAEATADETAAEPAPERAEPGAAEPEAQAAQPADERVETPEGRVFAAPSVRQLARELGVDIASVDGTGPSGRITESDVREAAERTVEPAPGAADDGATGAATDTTDAGPAVGDAEADAAEPTAVEAGAAPVESASRERTLAAPATRQLAQEEGVDLNAVPASETRDGEAFVTPEDVREYAAAQRAAQEADAAAAEAGAEPAGEATAETGDLSGERVPYRGVRRTIGEAMERSKYTAPHVTHHDVVEVTNLVELREEVKELAAERDVKLTYMPFVMKAVVAALKEFPFMNAVLDEDSEEIVLRDDYHVGVATATDAGLMVPVVENVDEKSIFQVAREMNEKVGKARDRSIAREELQGSTFSVTNVGAIGGEYATPILNYPETGILALGAIRDRPWVVERETDDGGTEKAVVPRKTVTLSLTIDHRIVDGAVAAEFTNKVKEYLANPKLLLLE
jgi:pyruvate dehydrogenase E2 component (dihydrolipoamide acetyltransferase)